MLEKMSPSSNAIRRKAPYLKLLYVVLNEFESVYGGDLTLIISSLVFRVAVSDSILAA